MVFSARAATKDAARPWRRRACTLPRFSSTLPTTFPEGNHPPETVGTSQCSNSVLDTVTLLTSQRRLR